MKVDETSKHDPRVLIVDNDPGSLVALGAVLDALPCRVITARSGREAVDRSHIDDFAAIIMDEPMPDPDGSAPASFIRQNPRSAATPILFISGHADIDVVHLTELYGNSGEVDALQKPFEPEIFASKIAAWLDSFRKEQESRK